MEKLSITNNKANVPCTKCYALLRHILSFEWRKLKKAKGKIYVEFR